MKHDERDMNDTCMARKVISAHLAYATTMRLFSYDTKNMNDTDMARKAISAHPVYASIN